MIAIRKGSIGNQFLHDVSGQNILTLLIMVLSQVPLSYSITHSIGIVSMKVFLTTNGAFGDLHFGRYVIPAQSFFSGTMILIVVVAGGLDTLTSSDL